MMIGHPEQIETALILVLVLGLVVMATALEVVLTAQI
jgi:hypothetical protein